MTLILCSFCLLAAPKGPTASKRWPIVFVPFIHGAGGYTTLDNNNLETGELAASFAVFYLKNYLVGGAQGEYRYFTATNRAKGESESFSGLEGSLLFGVYFKDGSKILAGWTPYSEIKSSASLSKSSKLSLYFFAASFVTKLLSGINFIISFSGNVPVP